MDQIGSPVGGSTHGIFVVHSIFNEVGFLLTFISMTNLLRSEE